MVIVAIAGIAIFFFRSIDHDPKFETPRDNIAELITPEGVDPVESVAQQKNSNTEPTTVTQDNGEEMPSNGLLGVIAATSDFLDGRSDKPDVLIDQLHAHFGMDRSQLRPAFRDLGTPTGIASVRQDVDSESNIHVLL